MNSLTKLRATWLVLKAKARYLNAQTEYNEACKVFDKSCQTGNFVNAMKAGHYFIVVIEEYSVCKIRLKEVKDELKAVRHARKNCNTSYNPLLWLRSNQFSGRTWLRILGFCGYILYCTKSGW
jgi:hypothetical protein